MFTFSQLQKLCIELKKTAREEIKKLVEEYGKLTFVDGEGHAFIDLAVGSLDRETDVYPDLQYVDAKGVHCVLACDCTEIDYNLTSTELSTDDLCNIVDNARLLVNSEFEICVRGNSIGRQNYKALLLLDSVMEWGEWEVVKVYPPENYLD